jgi:hypothetical protein
MDVKAQLSSIKAAEQVKVTDKRGKLGGVYRSVSTIGDSKTNQTNVERMNELRSSYGYKNNDNFANAYVQDNQS